MKHLIFIGLLSILCSCNQNLDTNPSNAQDWTTAYTDFPKLIDRHEALQYGKEWENIQSEYGSYRDQIIHQQDEVQARIKLAELFCNEAKITGEHPYYYPLALAQYDSALAILNGKETDETFRSLSGKASVFLSLHHFEDALQIGKKALALNAHNANIYGILTDANVELGNYTEAITYADKMVSIRPDIRSYSRISYLRELHGMTPEAIDAMKLAIQSSYPGTEDRAWAMVTLAHLLYDNQAFQESQNVVDRILSERPLYPFALEIKAMLEIQKGNQEEAEALLKQAISIIPEVSFQIQLAEIYKSQHRDIEFNNALQSIYEMMKEDSDKGHNMNLELAQLYLDLGNEPQKALELALKEYQVRPQNIMVNLLLSKIYLKQSKIENSKKHAIVASATNFEHQELKSIQNELRL
ncbi:MAG: tetratricopeptide repeat protein [Saprospiraceae bacterium]|nr:tetratricopeptide repeat protein [Saprospiraceae bacterium]